MTEHSNNFPPELAKFLVEKCSSDEDALALVILLHTHRIHWKVEVPALTQRDASAAVADAWSDRKDNERTNYMHWYRRFNLETPFEVVEDIVQPWAERVDALRRKLEAHPKVLSVESED
jgi:hypothetical protein